MGAVLVPIGSACARAKVLTRAWDRMALPLPFSRVAVVVGEPLHATATAEQIRAAIDEANAHATSALARDDRSTAIASTR
jgi:lysophospholipid acyltransferase (LPLAT)-like uncharacterized protein